MLFNSYAFIFVFLPITLVGFYWLGRYGGNLYACGWVALCSLFFYGWWNPKYVTLMLASMVFNYSAGALLTKTAGSRHKYRILFLAVCANLLLLGYYKYANFFVGALNAASGSTYKLQAIILPLGISFFTFTQIAFLVDVYRGIAVERNFIKYGLFVTYFPHLIAGPVLHHKEMMPQFSARKSFGVDYRFLSVGLTIFILGLFKKVMIADSVAVYAGRVFGAASQGTALSFFEAWGGALSYTVQLYFDFSGYSDMAVGLSLMFGICLPMNFFSPYKSRNIIEFWRRWHMTLSRFLRDYLYIPLGGNRHGEINRYRNLFITMVLGGLWHGAAWTFVFWGAFHGVLLAICHLWKSLVNDYKSTPRLKRIMTPIAYGSTFICVVIGWVFFRAESFDAALVVLKGLSGLSGFCLDPDQTRLYSWLTAIGLPVEYSGQAARFVDKETFDWLLVSLIIIWCAPNVYQIMSKEKPVLDESGLLAENAASRWQWEPNNRWLRIVLVAAAAAVFSLHKVSEFLYFQF